MQSLTIEWACERWALLPDKAVHWPARRTLIIADPHFGKADHFRHHGVPVPWGTTDANLRRLDAMLDATGAERLLVLGDLFHARTGLSELMLERLLAWRSTREQLDVIAVRGNHDRHAGPAPDELRITDVGDVLREGSLSFQHEPPADNDGWTEADAPTMAGHLHPAVRLHAQAGPGMRLPCYWFAPRVAVLPAFGAFTGMHVVRPQVGDRVFAVGPDQVIEVTPPVPAGRASPAADAAP